MRAIPGYHQMSGLFRFSFFAPFDRVPRIALGRFVILRYFLVEDETN
jgi:hypothetical protein